ncbi:uncharacterized protein LOC133722974 [Rosa rugosa]|uniref:uncharacterized protein LOC133722974 n=1 Tax=Rosa rugosa TaxID=74645 RepID=UPI002B416761|nr:uncharacterized protein LOC133722974 [Rosa rugosa]
MEKSDLNTIRKVADKVILKWRQDREKKEEEQEEQEEQEEEEEEEEYNASQPYYPGYPHQGAAVAPTQQTSQAGGYYQAPPSTAPYYNASPPSYHTSGQGHGYPQYGYNQQSYPQDGYDIYQPPGYDQHGYHGLSPTSQTGYWTQQPAQYGYGYGDAQSSYGSTAAQPGYDTPSYGAPPFGQPGYGAPPSGQPGYGAAGYTQPSTYSLDGGNGNTHGA